MGLRNGGGGGGVLAGGGGDGRKVGRGGGGPLAIISTIASKCANRMSQSRGTSASKASRVSPSDTNTNMGTIL